MSTETTRNEYASAIKSREAAFDAVCDAEELRDANFTDATCDALLVAESALRAADSRLSAAIARMQFEDSNCIGN